MFLLAPELSVSLKNPSPTLAGNMLVGAVAVATGFEVVMGGGGSIFSRVGVPLKS